MRSVLPPITVSQCTYKKTKIEQDTTPYHTKTMVCTNPNLQRSCSVLLLTIVVVIGQCDGLALNWLTSTGVETVSGHGIVGRRHRHYSSISISGTTSLYGKWDDLVDEDDIREVC